MATDCPHAGLTQPAFPPKLISGPELELGMLGGHRLHAHGWSSDRLQLNQILAGVGVRALLEAWGLGGGRAGKPISIQCVGSERARSSLYKEHKIR